MLLDWYDRHRRQLPWRAPPGQLADPYHVWLSEIMLQQTTVATVGPYFLRFLARWPRIGDLAAAELDAVLGEWQGLGYYARARNLHRCAKAVTGERGGKFPQEEAELLALPGIGPYTAAAIAAIAFDRPASPVDGNIERVMARLYRVTRALPAAKPILRDLARASTPRERAGDYAQGLMDLGATICRPKAPLCGQCPLQKHCAGARAGDAARLPRRAPKKTRPIKYGVAFLCLDRSGAVLLRRRPERGLLGGMIEVPSTSWVATPWRGTAALKLAPVKAAWRKSPSEIRHIFTHFELRLAVMIGRVARRPKLAGDARWCRPEDFASQALPSVMKKVLKLLPKAAGR